MCKLITNLHNNEKIQYLQIINGREKGDVHKTLVKVEFKYTVHEIHNSVCINIYYFYLCTYIITVLIYLFLVSFVEF